jgi:putative ABC transport system permease protein
MKYLPLVWAGLWRTPVRTVLTFLSIASTFLLFGSLYGIDAGLDQAIERISANRLHVTPVNLDRGLPEYYKQQVDVIPGVASTMISTLISAYYHDPQNLLYIAAIGGHAHLDMFGDIPDADRLVAELQAKRTGALVGRATADKNGWKIGDRVPLNTGPTLNQDGTDYMVFDIVDIYDEPTAPELAHWFLLNYDYLEDVRGQLHKGQTTDLYVDTADPARNEEVAQAIDRHFYSGEAATYTAPEREYRRSAFNRAIDMKLAVTVIISASMFALLMLSTNTMMQSVRRRVPELAVLKSVGFTDSALVLFVTSEGILLFVSAAMLGVAAAKWLYPSLAKAISGPVAAMPAHVPVVAVLIGVLAAIVSSLLPALRIRRVEVAPALARTY